MPSRTLGDEFSVIDLCDEAQAPEPASAGFAHRTHTPVSFAGPTGMGEAWCYPP